MNTILEYIMANYTWILCGIIIILLAIIGSYADKTNFGQGKQKNELNEDDKKLTDEVLTQNSNLEVEKKLDTKENVEQSNQEKSKNKKSKKTIESNIDESNKEKTKSEDLVVEENDDNVEQELKKEKKLKDFEKQFEEFDQEFNEALPKKEFISEDLLDEIDGLSLDKTQRLNFAEIPDLDDVELPKIKKLKSDKDEDIWKF